MSNDSYSEDFYEDDDLYYSELEYDNDFEYENSSKNIENDNEKTKVETIGYEEYDYDRDDYGDYDNNYKYDDYDDYEYEETSNKKYHLKDGIKKVFIVILIILLIFILVLFFKSLKKTKPNKVSGDDIKVIKKVTDSYEDIFDKMKNASLKYFTEERINDENVLTLNEMKELNLVENIDNKYDSVKSKATIKDGKLKVEVFENEKNKTKTYIVGNYIYCKDTYYCEKSSTLESKSYEYSKEGDKHLSDWSDWSEDEETSCDTEKVTCSKTDYDCLTEVKTSSKAATSTQDMIYQTSRNAFRTIEKEIKQICSSYDYIKINGFYYRTEKDSNFKMAANIKSNTKSNYYNWIYNGRKKYHNPPSDTINTRYVFVEEDYSSCKDTCSDHPDYYYDSYTFTKQLVKVSNTTSDCNNYITKVVPNYSIEEQKITVSRKESVNNTVCYKSIRTREVTQDEKDIKWSNYNDKKLLDNNYIYTGEYK